MVAITQDRVTTARHELVAAKEEFTDAKYMLNAAEHQVYTTKHKPTAADNKVTDAKDKLNAAKSRFTGAQAEYIIAEHKFSTIEEEHEAMVFTLTPLDNLATDCLRLSMHFFHPIQQCAQQVYHTALPLSPTSSQLHVLWLQNIIYNQLSSVTGFSGAPHSWSSLLRTIGVRPRELTCIATSVSRGLSAAYCWDTRGIALGLWSANGGESGMLGGEGG